MGLRTLFKNIKKLSRSNFEVPNYKARDFELEKVQLLTGRLLATQVSQVGVISNIKEAEFKVFSQMGDDGIIQYLISKLDIPNKTFIEFGVENYIESNTRFLMMNNNWSGLIIDGSDANINQVKKSYYFWRYDLKAVSAFIDCNNIEMLIDGANFNTEIGILSIDIDGNDYWIWKQIQNIKPIIVIIEYNSVFGVKNPWTVPYDEKFVRSQAHYSNLFYGTSLMSLCDLAKEKGYSFVGCNSAGNNSYFVRSDKVGDIPVLSLEDGYTISKFSESRNEKGELTIIRGNDRLSILKDLNVYNTRTGKLEVIR